MIKFFLNFQKSKGFTLVELLISTAIVITCATIVVAIITSTFRTSNKTTTSEQLRQAADSVLSQLSDMIQFSDGFVEAQNIEDFGPTPMPTPIYTCQDNSSDTSVDAIQIKSNGQIRTIECDDNNNLLLDGASLFDPNKIEVIQCVISCAQASSQDSPVITISLDLSTPTVSGAPPETESQISSFSKTIRMQNLNQ